MTLHGIITKHHSYDFCKLKPNIFIFPNTIFFLIDFCVFLICLRYDLGQKTHFSCFPQKKTWPKPPPSPGHAAAKSPAGAEARWLNWRYDRGWPEQGGDPKSFGRHDHSGRDKHNIRMTYQNIEFPNQHLTYCKVFPTRTNTILFSIRYLEVF